MIGAGIALSSLALLALASRKGAVAWVPLPNPSNIGPMALGQAGAILLRNTTTNEQRQLPVQVVGVPQEGQPEVYTLLVGPALDGKVQPWGYGAGTFQQAGREYVFPVIGPVRAG